MRQLLDILPVGKALIAEEKHEDGSPHLHAYLKLTKTVNIKNKNKLDIKDGETVYHGNY